MIKFHWLLNGGLSFHDKEILVKQLEDNGYESILLAFNQNNTDPFINAVHLMPFTTKLKFIMAMRTYALSPRYCAMQCRAFYEIRGEQPILNLINGTADRDQELFGNGQTIDERRLLTNKFAEEVKKYSGAKIAFSGKSDQTILNVIEHGDMSFNLASDLTDELISTLKKHNKEVFGRIFIEISEGKSGIEEIHKDYAEQVVDDDTYYGIEERYNRNSIYGTVDQIAKKIIELADRGIDNILLSAHDQENIKEIEKTHDIIKRVRELGY